MKTISKKSTQKSTKRITLILIIIAILSIFFSLLCPFISTSGNSLAASSPYFYKKYQTVSVNQKIQYRIKNLKKSNYVLFSTSNSALATIHKKSGILIPKKVGKVTIKANIYNQNNKKIKTLLNTVTIKKNILPNAIFKVKESINPWNFTISLSCSRILLKNEICQDILNIFPKGKKSPLLKASFSRLASNGKEVIYTLLPSSQTKLCPGDFSMDGSYIAESSCFSKKLTLTYQERLPQNTLSGFVVDTDGNPVKKALISLKKGTITNQTCYTDNNGYYQLRNIYEADSLIIEKEGFQKNVIENPAISSKGTTCENAILRNSNETSVALKLLVTDTDNVPISNALIRIFSDKKQQSDSMLYKRDSYSESDFLYFGYTDANGTHLLSNKDIIPISRCSNLTLNKNTSLSYSAQSDFSSTKAVILSPSILNTINNYFIYVSKFSIEEPYTAYSTKKIQFSFHNLATNQAFLHIQLEKCSNTRINDLSLTYDNSLSHCHAISLNFFHSEKQKFFYQITVDKRYFQINDNTIKLSYLLPVSFPDDTYYLSVQTLTEDGQILAESPICPTIIQTSTISSQEIPLYSPRYARALIFGNFTNNLPYKCSFSLYQKCDNNYFLINNYFSEPFSQNENHIITSELLLSHLLPNQNYLLLSASDSITLKENIIFSTTEKNIFLSKKEAEHSTFPLTQICCSSSELENTQIIPKEFIHTGISITYHTYHNITQSFIRSSQNYLNCVIAFYKKDGTPLTRMLTSPPIDNTLNTFSQNNYNETNSIIDIYTNKEILITNQDSCI